MSLGNNEPLVLTLGGDENVTVGGPDIPYVTDFATSLTGGQVKTRLQKWISRKTMSYDDTMQVAETLATEFVNFVRTAPKVSQIFFLFFFANFIFTHIFYLSMMPCPTRSLLSPELS